MTIGTALRLLAVMVLWASCFPLITIGLDLAPHLAFAALRAALAGLCLIILGALCGRPVPDSGRSWILIVVVGLGATSMGFLGMFHAAEFVSPGLATVIANVQPIIAAVLAHVFLGERLRAVGKFGLAVGLGGITVIALPGLAADHIQGYSIGIAYVVLAATGVSVGNVAIKRLTGQVDPIMTMGCQLLVGAVPLALLSMLTEDVSSLTWSTEFVLVLVRSWDQRLHSGSGSRRWSECRSIGRTPSRFWCQSSGSCSARHFSANASRQSKSRVSSWC